MNRVMFSSASGDWETPQELFDELNMEFRFMLDPCATRETRKCGNWYEVGGLERPWEWTTFCNPPYGREIGKWVRKGYRESLLGTTVVMLLPARTDTRWWHDYVMKADEIRFIKGRLHFSGHKNAAPFPSCVVVFRGGQDGA